MLHALIFTSDECTTLFILVEGMSIFTSDNIQTLKASEYCYARKYYHANVPE